MGRIEVPRALVNVLREKRCCDGVDVQTTDSECICPRVLKGVGLRHWLLAFDLVEATRQGSLELQLQ